MEISYNNFLIKIRSKYILKQIFDNLQEIKLLEIIRYNKNIQNQLNKGLKDYINEYSKIEIEIIPKEKAHGKFINMPKKYESYYHIYFNDDEDEIKRIKLDKKENISKIKIILDYKVKSLTKLFYKCKCIEKISFIKFNRKDFLDMSYMFYDCSALKELNFMKINTENVTNMRCMFYDCFNLEEINFFNINTKNVTWVLCFVDVLH